MNAPDVSCDGWLPTCQWRTAHSRLVRADKATVAEAVRAVTPADMLVLRPLMFVRSIPARLSRTEEAHLGHHQPVLTGLQEGGEAFVLADEPGGDVVVGFAGQPWGLRQHWVTLTPEQYRDFDEPLSIKGLMAFTVVEEAGGTRLHTETRVHATDAASERKFRRYWLLIGPFSGLIRHDWLAAAARRAEKPPRPDRGDR
ncbi:conserved hypothetical protein [Kribbella flavida DSM 17836]|uniref:DUF1990 domain-containing protein n=1 Tax=Kribbella flavida (strain DSM 17836 / JCM 10339 / NBRC 14399) TaxID=479435 RepID=D2Q3C7_KRIFD|nr:hypothetical protein [Kribbella flavida]ADB34050.1 conserved hypothetical protein [Kribbella flavida DSM 17836]